MKLRKTWATVLAVALVATTGASAYAASTDIRDTVDNLIANVQTCAESEKMSPIPDDAVMFGMEVLEDSIDADLTAYAEGQMSPIPDGAVMFGMEVLEDSIDADLTTYAEAQMSAILDGAVLFEAKVIAE